MSKTIPLVFFTSMLFMLVGLVGLVLSIDILYTVGLGGGLIGGGVMLLLIMYDVAFGS